MNGSELRTYGSRVLNNMIWSGSERRMTWCVCVCVRAHGIVVGQGKPSVLAGTNMADRGRMPAWKAFLILPCGAFHISWTMRAT